MIEALLAFGVMLLIVGGMSVGVMAGRKPIAGSCGGLANLGVDGECEICGGNPARCETTPADNSVGRDAADLAVDATANPGSPAKREPVGKREL